MIEPLVILPGFMQDARAFMPQLVHLGADRPVILMPPAAGDSIEQISLAYLAQLPESFAVLGHGLGGYVALDLLRRIPQRISRIALIGTDALPERPSDAAARERRLLAARAGQLDEALAGDLPGTALAETPWRDEVRALALDMGMAMGLEAYLRQSRLMQRRPDQQMTLRQVKVPALILAGAADTLLPPRRAEFLAGLMPFGRMELVEGAGHLLQLEQPEAVSAILRDFLAGPLLLR